MKISKLKVIAKYFTGGIAGVVEYVLDAFNDLISRLPVAEVAKYAQLAKDVANFVDNVANILIMNEAKKATAQITAQSFALLATALIDAKITRDELTGIVGAVKESVEAWKKAK